MRVARQRARVLPLRLVSGGSREGHLENLVLGDLVRVAVLERELLEEVQVEAILLLRGEGRLEVGIAQRDLLRTACRNLQEFVLRIVLRPQARGAV